MEADRQMLRDQPIQEPEQKFHDLVTVSIEMPTNGAVMEAPAWVGSHGGGAPPPIPGRGRFPHGQRSAAHLRQCPRTG